MAFTEQIASFFEARIFLLVAFWSLSLLSLYFGYVLKNRKLLLISLVILLFPLFSSWRIISEARYAPKVLLISPVNNSKILSEPPNIDVTFSSPVVYQKLIINTHPHIEFSLKKQGYLWNLLPFGTRLTIIPKITLPPGERIMTYFSNIEGPLTKGYGGEHLHVMKVEDPLVASITPSDKSEDLPISQEFDINLTSPILNLNEWTVRSDPMLLLSLKQVGTQSIRIKPDQPYQQGIKYKFTLVHAPLITSRDNKSVVRRLDPKSKSEVNFSVVKPVLISSFTPVGNTINPNEPIVINFVEAIDSSMSNQFIRISPEVSYNPVWSSNESQLTLNHDELKKNTDYSIILAKGFKTQKGGTLESNIKFGFRTPGPLQLTESNPTDKSQNVHQNTLIKLTFNQQVPESIKDYIKISPDVEGSFTVKDTIVEFAPKNSLRYEFQYIVTILSQAPSTYGLPSFAEQSLTFTTQPDQVKLDVPYFRQETAFTCNIAASRMLLGYRGISVTEQDLINKVGSGGKRGSGNPHKGYINDFGTYWDPIHRGVKEYHGAHLITSGNLEDLLKEVKKGNPVMTWGQNGWSDPHEISWTASDGTYIKAINGMHSVVITGYIGSVDNPHEIYINDPWRGQYSLTTEVFLQRWNFYKMAMVIE